MGKQYSCLDEYEWLGEFWVPGDKSKTFSGVLKYTPNDGISISALVPFAEKEIINSKVFHGYCQKTGFITLMGCFVLSEGETNFITLSPHLFCNYLIIGGEFLQDDEFNGCSLEPSNFREFCYPQGFNLDDTYKKEPILEAVLNDMTVSVKKTIRGSFLSPEKVSSRIWIDEENSGFEIELNDAVSDVIKKHGVKNLFTKSDVGTEIEFTMTDHSKMNCASCANAGLCLTTLLSTLIIRPVSPKYMSLFRFADDDGRTRKTIFPMLSSLMLSNKEQRLMSKDINYNFLSVNINDIKDNFAVIMKEWYSIYSDSTDFILSVLSEHIYGQQNPIQHTVVSISALEQWFSKYEKDKENILKYDYMINKYSTNAMNIYLEEQVPLKRSANDTLGKCLSDVRNLILHPSGDINKKFKIGRTLEQSSLLNISEVIFLILLRALYTKLGISQVAINKIGSKDNPVLHRHSNIEL